jgi:hypothetical protein
MQGLIQMEDPPEDDDLEDPDAPTRTRAPRGAQTWL